MIDSVTHELHPFIFIFVKSNNMVDSEVSKNLEIVFWSIASLFTFRLIYWSHKRYKLSWNDPVKISILQLLVVLVLG